MDIGLIAGLRVAASYLDKCAEQANEQMERHLILGNYHSAAESEERRRNAEEYANHIRDMADGNGW